MLANRCVVLIPSLLIGFYCCTRSLTHTTSPIAEEGAELDARLSKYCMDAAHVYQFPIGEALLTQGSAIAPRSVPFIKVCIARTASSVCMGGRGSTYIDYKGD